MKILTVEDDKLIREGISEYLSEFGYTVIQAKDGREALSKFNSDINLVILDIQIPFINGLEVLKEIRKKSNLPILILTAFSDEEYLNVGDTLDEVLEKYSILVNQKKININKELLDYNIYIGKTALNIVFSNLISNAVKYTNRNGIINIKIANDWLLIENSYDKNKISKINKILDASFDLKLDNSNGLGLNIVKNILNKYNIKYEILHGENYFIFKIKIIS